MTGVLDMRTPMPQSEEYYAALKMRGVDTKLLRFEGEYHGTRIEAVELHADAAVHDELVQGSQPPGGGDRSVALIEETKT